MKRGLKLHQARLMLVLLPIVLLAIVAYQNARRVRHLAGLKGEAVTIAYSPQGDKIVCSTNRLSVQLWEPQSKKWQTFQDIGHSGSSSGNFVFAPLRFLPDGKALYGLHMVSYETVANYLQRWNVRSRKQEHVFVGVSEAAFDVSPDGHWAASIGFYFNLKSEALHLLDLTRATKSPGQSKFSPHHSDFFFHSLAPLTIEPFAVAFAPSSQTLALWDGYSGIELRAVPSGKLLRKFSSPAFMTPGIPKAVSEQFPIKLAALDWSPDGQWIAACDDTSLQIWKSDGSQSHSAILPAPIATRGVGGKRPKLSWSRDGKQLATGGDSVCVWNVPDLKLQRQFRAQGGVAFAPDGRTLATGGAEGAHEVLLWPLKNWPF